MAERVRITVGSGRVEVVAEARDTITASPDSIPITRAPEVLVHGDSDAFTVRVPTGTDVVVGSDSGDIELVGRFGAVSITTSSAAIQVDEVASVDVRSHSGRIQVARSHGGVRAGSQSATISIGRADGEVRAATDSGRIQLDDARGALAAKTVSGEIDVTVSGPGPVRLETVSGTIEVAVPAGVRPHVRHRSTSGDLRVDPEPGDDVEILARSVSGDVQVRVT
jgi:DUF4097 and DUF4098 domain-containing protein YvlB